MSSNVTQQRSHSARARGELLYVENTHNQRGLDYNPPPRQHSNYHTQPAISHSSSNASYNTLNSPKRKRIIQSEAREFLVSPSGSTVTSPKSVFGEDGDYVRVCLRIRPLMSFELERGDIKCLQASGDGINAQLKGIVRGTNSPTNSLKDFRFDMTFDERTPQAQVFENCGITHMLDQALDGYAATVFAYGQTGSGKTFSMSGVEEKLSDTSYHGNEESDGLIPRSVRYLFEAVSRAKFERVNCTVKASYCEIYNEQAYDLLDLSKGTLSIRWSLDHGFYVQDLFVVSVDTVDDMFAVISEGHRNRRIGSHEMNKDSSRSHSILTISIDSQVIDKEFGDTIVRHGKIVFVDLAGSERLDNTKSAGVALKETGNINRSLFVLGKVISALSTNSNSKEKPHIPYRDSKLTKLLMDSLGGSSLTLMIACVSSSSEYHEETQSTLNYATRARNIQNKPTVHIDPKEKMIHDLRAEIKLLRSENNMLRQHLPPNFAINIPVTSSGSTSGSATPVKYLPTLPTSPRSMSSVSNDHTSTPGSSHSSSPSHTYNRRRSQSAALFRRMSSASSTDSAGYLTGVPASNNNNNNNNNNNSNNNKMLLTSRNGTNHLNSNMNNGAMQSSYSIQRVIVDYTRALDRVKGENNNLRKSCSIAEQGYRSVMQENERLCSKLEHLEEVFLSAGDEYSSLLSNIDSSEYIENNVKNSTSNMSSSSNTAGELEVKTKPFNENDELRKENSLLRVRLHQFELNQVPYTPTKTATNKFNIKSQNSMAEYTKTEMLHLKRANLDLRRQNDFLLRKQDVEKRQKHTNDIIENHNNSNIMLDYRRNSPRWRTPIHPDTMSNSMHSASSFISSTSDAREFMKQNSRQYSNTYNMYSAVTSTGGNSGVHSPSSVTENDPSADKSSLYYQREGGEREKRKGESRDRTGTRNNAVGNYSKPPGINI